MSHDSEKFYCTTAIDYPNGSPHMGHAYEKIVTDAYERWYKLMGAETYFLTGTDENGQKLVESAKAANTPTGQYVDEQVVKFKKLCKDLGIGNNDFIRTTEKRHMDVCQDFWQRLSKSGEIYAGTYSGHYCLACESFYTDLQAPDKICPNHNTPLTLKEEAGYFFKLSKYQDWIIKHIEDNPRFVAPSSAYKEILSRLKGEPVRDLAISRPNDNGWGVPVPGDEKYVMYTWFDALINYYSAVADKPGIWPAQMHVIGKDILWFHAVIWPCMLQALGEKLPEQIYVHGMILGQDGRKMSKSLNNGVDPYSMLELVPVDTFRYYLLRSISSSGDGAFVVKELIDRHNNELGNDFGNFIMRFIKLSLKLLPPEIDATDVVQEIDFSPNLERMKECMDKRQHDRALDALWDCVIKGNQYVNDKEPWKLKTDLKALKNVVYNCSFGLHQIGMWLSPFMPAAAETALSYIGRKTSEIPVFGETYHLSMPEALFQKILKEDE